MRHRDQPRALVDRGADGVGVDRHPVLALDDDDARAEPRGHCLDGVAHARKVERGHHDRVAAARVIERGDDGRVGQRDGGRHRDRAGGGADERGDDVPDRDR